MELGFPDHLLYVLWSGVRDGSLGDPEEQGEHFVAVGVVDCPYLATRDVFRVEFDVDVDVVFSIVVVDLKRLWGGRERGRRGTCSLANLSIRVENVTLHGLPVPTAGDVALVQQCRHCLIILCPCVLAVIIFHQAEDNAFHHARRVCRTGWKVLIEIERFLVGERDDVVAFDGNCEVQEVNRCREVFELPREDPEVVCLVLEVGPLVRRAVVNPNAKSKDRGNWIPFQI